MKTFEELKREVTNLESAFQSKVIGGQPNEPICNETPLPVEGTNCTKTYAQSYEGGVYCGLDQGWVCDDTFHS